MKSSNAHRDRYVGATLEQFSCNSNLSGGENGACGAFRNYQSFKMSPQSPT